MELLKNIKQLRTDREWTHEQMGYRLGMSKQAYERLENGRNQTLNYGVIEQIAEIFEMTTAELISYNSSENTARKLLEEAIQHFEKGQAKVAEAKKILEQEKP